MVSSGIFKAVQNGVELSCQIQKSPVQEQSAGGGGGCGLASEGKNGREKDA
jgi:hypothetical protein